MSMKDNYISLTSIDDKPVYINPDTITAIYVDIPAFYEADATAVCFDGTMLFVKESPSYVLHMIGSRKLPL